MISYEYVKGEERPNKIYHLSKENLDDKTLNPRIPNNFLVKNGYEDNKTKRVCFSKSIKGSLRAMSSNIKGKEFYVHIPYKKYEVYEPSVEEVPDKIQTKEVWIKEPVKLSCIGKIRVIRSIGTPLPYKYGGTTAYLYDWKYEVLEAY